jgi:aldehyde dehydrogenase
LVHEKIYDKFMEKAIARVEKITVGNPFELATMMGPQASEEQFKKVLSYIDIGKNEGGKLRTGGERPKLGGELEGGYYVKPTVFEGNNSMRIFREEIFGPVVSVAKFKDFDDAIRIANDTIYGLTAGVWTRNINTAYRASRAIKAGRIWVNAYHLYPTHAAFGGYKQSGIGRENHRMMLAHFQQTKNVLTSYNPKAMGFF